MLRYRTKDDRGNACRVHALWLGESPTAHEIERRPIMAWMRWLLRAAGAVGFLVWSGPVARGAAIGIGFGIIIALVVYKGPFALAVTLFSPVSSTLILVVVSLTLSLVSSLAKLLGRSRERVLDALRCPGCFYSLAEIEAGEDNRTVCPECGSGWDLRPRGPAEVVVVRTIGAGSGDAATIAPRARYQRRERSAPPTIVASTGLPPSSYASARSSE